jgi:hypothetical protein
MQILWPSRFSLNNGLCLLQIVPDSEQSQSCLHVTNERIAFLLSEPLVIQGNLYNYMCDFANCRKLLYFFPFFELVENQVQAEENICKSILCNTLPPLVSLVHVFKVHPVANDLRIS